MAVMAKRTKRDQATKCADAILAERSFTANRPIQIFKGIAGSSLLSWHTIHRACSHCLIQAASRHAMTISQFMQKATWPRCLVPVNPRRELWRILAVSDNAA
jgi:hypothetical protein